MTGDGRTQKIGFVGLGNMGGPMAANLVTAGHAVRGFDIVPEARRAAADHGIAIAESVNAAVDGCNVVITMLPAGRHVLEVYEGGLLDACPRDALLIDCSTIDMASARQAHQHATDVGLAAVDAPVSGGIAAAAAGTLTFMAGGSAEAFARAEPILACMGKTLVHCGEAGAGQAAKICNNMILGISMIAVSEAFVLAEALGLSHQALFDVASKASGQCWSLTSYCPVPGPVPTSPANRDYVPGFAAALMLKDLELAKAAAAEGGVSTILGGQAAALFRAFVTMGNGHRDFSAIINAVREGAENRDFH